MESPTATTVRTRFLAVRFEDSCVLIPPQEPSKPGIRPRLVRKSYSLPLWKTTPSKKTVPAPLSPVDLTESDDVDGNKADKKPFSLTVSVPSLTIKSKRRRPSLPPSPCLAKRNPGSPTSPDVTLASHVHIFSPPPLLRAPSFPAVQPASLTEGVTVPLRPCCEACYPCVDAALAKGEHWNEKWSSGAVRRYSEGEHAHLHARPVFGVTRTWTPSGADVPLAAALQVDEVEVKRRASEDGNAPRRCLEENALADSDDEESTDPPVLPVPVQEEEEEEDEDLLFPLPSPRRTPNASPYATPLSGSQVSLTTPTRVETPVPAPAPALPTLAIPISAPRSESVVSESPKHTRPPVSSPIEISEPQRRGSPVLSRQAASPPATAQPRRPSFSSASGSLLKGSAAVLKGVAAGMSGATVGVVR